MKMKVKHLPLKVNFLVADKFEICNWYDNLFRLKVLLYCFYLFIMLFYLFSWLHVPRFYSLILSINKRVLMSFQVKVHRWNFQGNLFIETFRRMIPIVFLFLPFYLRFTSVKLFCLSIKTFLASEPIGLSCLGKLHMSPVLDLCNFIFKSWNGFMLFFLWASLTHARGTADQNEFVALNM